jgi:hypothetical protein
LGEVGKTLSGVSGCSTMESGFWFVEHQDPCGFPRDLRYSEQDRDRRPAPFSGGQVSERYASPGRCVCGEEANGAALQPIVNGEELRLDVGCYR